jgi:poly-gamma-glutamate capsule biosynthesis protein CapA/YwtB (metallophosphatase superfamily)
MALARAAVAALSAVVLAAACSGAGPDLADPGVAAAGPTRPADSAASSTVRASTTTVRPLRRFTIAASGDILLHNLVIQSGKANAGGNGYDFDPMFDDVRATISGADLAICHQETPISADDTALTVPLTLSFNAPREIATALKNAGFDGCDTASNHTYDRGLAGVRATLDVLDAAGLRHAGSSRDQAEADNPPIYDVQGVKVGQLAFSYTILNEGGPSQNVPKDAPWLEAMLWPKLGIAGVLAQAHRLKERGAEYVVVSMHWGSQYVHQPTKDQRDYARAMLESPDVDLVLGDHVHVVQPCEKINGKYVIYGMGNFLSNQSPTQDATLVKDNQDGSIVSFTVEERSPGTFATTRMQFTPTWVVIPGHHIERATPDVHADSYDRTVKSMLALGPAACDATPIP